MPARGSHLVQQYAYTTERGYVRIRVGVNRWAMQHRRIMEKHIGRPLRADEDVHHKNGVKSDNQLENLAIVLHSPHAKHHNPRGAVVCVLCGKTDIGLRGENRICRGHCQAHYQRLRKGQPIDQGRLTVPLHDQETICDLASLGKSTRQIARIVGWGHTVIGRILNDTYAY